MILKGEYDVKDTYILFAICIIIISYLLNKPVKGIVFMFVLLIMLIAKLLDSNIYAFYRR